MQPDRPAPFHRRHSRHWPCPPCKASPRHRPFHWLWLGSRHRPQHRLRRRLGHRSRLRHTVTTPALAWNRVAQKKRGRTLRSDSGRALWRFRRNTQAGRKKPSPPERGRLPFPLRRLRLPSPRCLTPGRPPPPHPSCRVRRLPLPRARERTLATGPRRVWDNTRQSPCGRTTHRGCRQAILRPWVPISSRTNGPNPPRPRFQTCRVRGRTPRRRTPGPPPCVRQPRPRTRFCSQPCCLSTCH